ncbi:hypothetical protein BUALT_Bualt04G0040700 [Buddleja alternifolia]|uniref:Transposase n=1 Tax=Buddleja alternifolia TaxID=168488 RepID=A0AAV6XWT7_9LAMI|nr:hypothetical protein BUALT_Bualt04G0040700 [Buddleja alternifolia]
MDMGTFARLFYLLHNVGGLSDSKRVKLEEKVCFFLTVLAHHKNNRIVKFDHVRSGHTVSIYFNAVVISLLKLHLILLVTLKPVDDEYDVARWKHFKGCLGALDGTYIDVQPRLLDKPRYRNRKGGISVNVLGVVDRNMDFVYMLPGWEGSAADGRVLRDVVNRPNGPMNRMILSCTLLHNFIRREMEVDPVEAHVLDLAPNHRNLYADDQPAEDEFVESVGPNHEWSAWRDNLANDMFTEWSIKDHGVVWNNASSYQGKNMVTCSRMWTKPEKDVLVQSLKEIISTGWKADNGFRVGYLNILQDKIMRAFPRTDLRANPHISSKMHSWKKQYNSLYTIFGGTGVGWNPTTKMIDTADDAAWETACKNELNARTMRYKSWLYYDSWCEVFGKDGANGTGAEDFHDALNGVLHNESQPRSPLGPIWRTWIQHTLQKWRKWEQLRSVSRVVAVQPSQQRRGKGRRMTV